MKEVHILDNGDYLFIGNKSSKSVTHSIFRIGKNCCNEYCLEDFDIAFHDMLDEHLICCEKHKKDIQNIHICIDKNGNIDTKEIESPIIPCDNLSGCCFSRRISDIRLFIDGLTENNENFAHFGIDSDFLPIRLGYFCIIKDKIFVSITNPVGHSNDFHEEIISVSKFSALFSFTLCDREMPVRKLSFDSIPDIKKFIIYNKMLCKHDPVTEHIANDMYIDQKLLANATTIKDFQWIGRMNFSKNRNFITDITINFS